MFFVQTPRLLLRKVREEDYPYFRNNVGSILEVLCVMMNMKRNRLRRS